MASLTIPQPPLLPPLPPPPPPPPLLSLPSSNVVLLTHVPSFLTNCLREWIAPCGPARTILKYEPIILAKNKNKNEDKMSTKNSSSSTDKEIKTFTALVTMMHGDGAWKLVSAVQNAPLTMTAYLVPASPSVLLESEVAQHSPPLQVDILVQSLMTLYQEFQSSSTKSLSLSKVAAAAGGNNYDEDADPLNAPAVLELVQQFRKSLETSQTTQQRRRAQFVQERLEQALKERTKYALLSMTSPSLDVPPPTLPMLPPPPPPLPMLPPPPPLLLDTTVLPLVLPSEPPVKKLKAAATTLTEEMKPILRTFIASQILQYLGEEEKTLIDFCWQYVLDQKSWDGLLEELTLVLDEDAGSFVESLKQKVQELLEEG